MNVSKITIDIVLLLVVIAGLVSFFYNPLNTDMTYLQVTMGAIIGYFIGVGQIPVMRGIK